jgi:branched-chain amino acid transport system ATP-binding protein
VEEGTEDVTEALGATELRAQRLSVIFGQLHALREVDFWVREGEVVGLIGPNGAGKTTLVNVLSGYQRPTRGRVTIANVDVTQWSPDRLARTGLARTFQGARAFSGLSVHDNLMAAAIGAGKSRRKCRPLVLELLDLFQLSPWSRTRAGALPFGLAKLLAVARAVATRPRFLLLDEPVAGMNDAESDQFIAVLSSISGPSRCGIVVIEHDMSLIMRVCQRIHVLDHGITICVGRPTEVRTDPAVIKAYLGTEAEMHA